MLMVILIFCTGFLMMTLASIVSIGVIEIFSDE